MVTIIIFAAAFFIGFIIHNLEEFTDSFADFFIMPFNKTYQKLIPDNTRSQNIKQVLCDWDKSIKVINLKPFQLYHPAFTRGVKIDPHMEINQ